MKRYWLLAGDDYYPVGGMRDLAGCFDTIEEAKAFNCQADWAHIFDAQECKPVAARSSAHGWREVDRPLVQWLSLGH